MYLRLTLSIQQNTRIINKILYFLLDRIEYDYIRNYRLFLNRIETEICSDEKTKLFTKVELQFHLIATTVPSKCILMSNGYIIFIRMINLKLLINLIPNS